MFSVQYSNFSGIFAERVSVCLKGVLHRAPRLLELARKRRERAWFSFAIARVRPPEPL